MGVCNPKSVVQEIYTPGFKVLVDALHTIELDGGMEYVQVFNKLYKFLFSSSPPDLLKVKKCPGT
jgi:hypothetical protein